jgi:tryptophanyl-tRNA synthetase
MTQFKDKSARQAAVSGLGPTVGLFTYPILQAADILLYQAAEVPIGEDQRQHLELTRDLAQRFNHRFGETFRVPEPHIPKASSKILDLQIVDKQMSKSIGGAGCVWLLDDPAVNAKKVKRAVTDTETEVRFDPEHKPGVSNLLTILAVLTGRTVPEVEPGYAGKGYGALKTDVADALTEFATRYRDRTQQWLDDEAALDAVLAAGAARAQKVAAGTLARVYDAVGFLPARG